MNCAAFLLAESSSGSIFGLSESFPAVFVPLASSFHIGSSTSDQAYSDPPLSTGRRIVRAENFSYVNVEPNVELSTFIGLFLSSDYTHTRLYRARTWTSVS